MAAVRARLDLSINSMTSMRPSLEQVHELATETQSGELQIMKASFVIMIILKLNVTRKLWADSPEHTALSCGMNLQRSIAGIPAEIVF
jgi:hypothetical protein